MLEPVTRAGAASSGAVDPPRTTGDWVDEALSWASPDGLVLHAVQPVLAQGLRQSGVGQGTEWGRSLQRVLDDPRAVSSFQGGLREGTFNGAKGLVEGAWALAKGVGPLAYNENPLGSGLDALRHAGVGVPDWAPSADRIDRKMQAVGEGVGAYLSAVGQNPGKLGDDIKGWIGANWDALKADHARAAAQGPAAEAHWWGQVTGRATFEVAAVAVPVTKFATVARAGEALEVALKAGKLGETLAEAARAGKLGELFAAATKAGKLPELVSQARQAGRLPELVAEARKTTGGLEALAPHLRPSEMVSVAPGSIAVTGARQVLNPHTIEGWDKAEVAYDAIRADRSDVGKIAHNSGFSERDIARIKDHVFHREHQLDLGVRRFDADPDIVNAWSRLTRGDQVASDIDLLRHELFESRFEAVFRTNYRTAHDATIRTGRTWKGE